jgi:hypothetical protein
MEQPLLCYGLIGVHSHPRWFLTVAQAGSWPGCKRSACRKGQGTETCLTLYRSYGDQYVIKVLVRSAWMQLLSLDIPK